MNDSIKYGLPGGALLFALFYIQWISAIGGLTIPRWIVAVSLVTGVSIWFIKKANKAFFPMKYAWFSGFTVLFVAILVQDLLIVLFHEMLIGKEGDELSQILYMCFIEFLGQSFIGLFIITGFSVFFKKDHPHGN